MPRKLAIRNARGAPTLGITVLLASLSMISPLSTDTFLPSLPTIAEEFQISALRVQQLITAYLLPFACFALLHGPLSDALGRRRMVLGGLALYAMGSIGCFFAPSFGALLACRVLQGIAAGVGPTVARAMVRDLFEGPSAQKLMSGMMLVFSVAPAIAPIIGGWVHVSLGWRSVFGMLAIFGIALLALCWWRLPETHPPERRSRFHPVALAQSCWRVASQPAYLLLAFSSAMTFAAVFVYIGSAPMIILQRWHLGETQFYYLFLPVVAGLMCASWASGQLAGRIQRSQQLQMGFLALGLAALISAVLHLAIGALAIPVMQLLWFGMAFGAQLTYPILALEMIDMHPLARGAAASVQTFVALGIGSFFMGVAAPLLHGDLRLLAFLSLGSAILAWSAWRAGVAVRGSIRPESPTAAD
jgi:DHA1 family bicyclomycin/chloramphenicol resistance-like MFS transporter